MYYDKKGEPISAAMFGALKANESYCVLARDKTVKGALISTIWLGMDIGKPGVRQIFETAVWDSSSQEIFSVYRYGTEEEAIAGHRALLAKYGGKVFVADKDDKTAPRRKIEV